MESPESHFGTSGASRRASWLQVPPRILPGPSQNPPRTLQESLLEAPGADLGSNLSQLGTNLSQLEANLSHPEANLTQLEAKLNQLEAKLSQLEEI